MLIDIGIGNLSFIQGTGQVIYYDYCSIYMKNMLRKGKILIVPYNSTRVEPNSLS